MSNSSPSIPKAPNLGKTYQTGIDVYNANFPGQLSLEDMTRAGQDPQRIAEQQALQRLFGPTQYGQQLSALQQLDPEFVAARKAAGKNLLSQFELGPNLTPQQENQVEQGVRGAQAARGNVYGGAPATAEAYALGDRGQQIQQQRTANLLSFMVQPTNATQIGAIAPVSPDRSFGYVNPNAGYLGSNYALQNYQNQVASSQLGYSNPWASSLQGAGQGAQIGSLFGGYGAAIGAGLGGLYGGVNSAYGSSDRRLKENIKRVGTGPKGTGVFEFNYKPPRFRGAIAQDVEKHVPEAVSRDPATGYRRVDYSKIGMPMVRVR